MRISSLAELKMADRLAKCFIEAVTTVISELGKEIMKESIKTLTHKMIRLLPTDFTWWILAVALCLLCIGHRQGLPHGLKWDLGIALLTFVILRVVEGL